MNVCVLGCGPAGLLAAHAATQCGHEVEIISKKQPSVITGAQYLHERIEGITEREPEQLWYAKVGTAAGYAAKVYGKHDHPTSWHVFPDGPQDAWPLGAAYAQLRHMYWDKVMDIWELGGDGGVQQGEITAPDIMGLCDKYDQVLCTIPAQGLCHRHEHQFEGQQVLIMKAPVLPVQNLIIYNGRDGEPWYRTSNIFGYCSSEYSLAVPAVRNRVEQLTDGLGGWRGIKPVSTDCDCHQDWTNFHRLGRFGKWQKGVLVTDAYREAMDLFTPDLTVVRNEMH